MNRGEIRTYKKWLAQVIRKDKLTRHEIEQILDGQFELPEKEVDGNLIEECLLHLYPEYNPEYKKQDILDKKASCDKLLQLWKGVKREKGYSYDNTNTARRSHISTAMIMLLVLLGVMLLGTAIAYALGYPIWNYTFHWGDEQVRIDIEIQTPENSPGSSTANHRFGLGRGDAFDKKLKELQMDPILPMLPNEYTLTVEDSSCGDTIRNIVGLYSAGSSTLHVNVTKVNDVNAALVETIEKDGNEYDMIEMEGSNYYFFNNLDTSEVIWVSPPYIIQLGGDISKDKLLSMIEAMNGGI